ncbi:hypothetical protein INT43_001892 [Umbelopsis isabellina]|uniref:SAP domain-containing protein n=1 Tax=Mortierella isabellina TaxID=91625 RepID=A0A8H7PRU3_MORIS|nr:hypothetical protein INT43_001892 [Umbelopsis isabellina]
MFMQRTGSGTFLPYSQNHQHTPDLNALELDLDDSIDPFLTDLTADLYIDPNTAEQNDVMVEAQPAHAPPTDFGVPSNEMYDTSIEDLWANITFDQSVNEDIQPMSIPNVISSSGNNTASDLSQSCPSISYAQNNHNFNMFNHPTQSSPLANRGYSSPSPPPHSGARPSDKRGRMAPVVREQGGIRALFSPAHPKAPPHMVEKEPLRRSASAHGKLGIRKKPSHSPRIKKAGLPLMDAHNPPSDMQTAYRMNQMAGTPDAMDTTMTTSSPMSPISMPVSDTFTGSPMPVLSSSFTPMEQPYMERERRRSTSLPPMQASTYSSSVPNYGIHMQQPSPYSMPGTPPPRTMPMQISRNSKAPSQSASLSAEEQQKILDERLMKIDFDDITVSELKDMLRERKKATNGKKADLVERLLDERRMIEMRRQGLVDNSMFGGQTSFSMPNSWMLQ